MRKWYVVDNWAKEHTHYWLSPNSLLCVSNKILIWKKKIRNEYLRSYCNEQKSSCPCCLCGARTWCRCWWEHNRWPDNNFKCHIHRHSILSGTMATLNWEDIVLYSNLYCIKQWAWECRKPIAEKTRVYRICW